MRSETAGLHLCSLILVSSTYCKQDQSAAEEHDTEKFRTDTKVTQPAICHTLLPLINNKTKDDYHVFLYFNIVAISGVISVTLTDHVYMILLKG